MRDKTAPTIKAMSAAEKHELFSGVVYAMAAASRLHNRISHNLNGLIWNALRGQPCHGYAADFKVRAGKHCFYPDAMIVCGKDQLRDDKKDVLINPTVYLCCK